jgi:hypothetical protein
MLALNIIFILLAASMPRTSASSATRMVACSYTDKFDCSVLVPRCLQTFSPQVCELVGVPVGSRGQLCEQHSKIDVCSARVPGVCKHKAVDWFDSRRHPMNELSMQHCTALSLEEVIVGSLDQVDQKSVARICTGCRTRAHNLLSPEWRQRRYVQNEKQCNKAIYVKPAVASLVGPTHALARENAF